MASTPKIEYQVFLCIFQKTSTMATLGLKEMGKFLWEGREKGLPSKQMYLKKNLVLCHVLGHFQMFCFMHCIIKQNN